MADVLLQEVAQALTQVADQTLRPLLMGDPQYAQHFFTDKGRAAARLLLLQWRSRDAFQDFGEFYCIRLILDEQSALASYFIGLFSELDWLLAGELMWLGSTPLGLQVRRISATCRLLYAASRLVPRQDVGNNSGEFKRVGQSGRMFSSNELHCKMRQVGLVNLDQQRVPRVSLCKEPLGKGMSATVYKGVFEGIHVVDTNYQEKIIGDPVAVKMFSNFSGTDDSSASVSFGIRLRQSTEEVTHLPASNKMLPECSEDAGLRAELGRLVSVRHPNIVIAKGYIGKREQQGESGLVMELMDESLHDYLQKVQGKSVLPLDELEMVDLMLEIAKGMQFLHECNLMHRDLKPKNVLLRLYSTDQVGGKQFEVKLADFGLTKLYSLAQDGVQDRHTHTAKVGTSCYMAPELRAKTRPIYDEKIDIFSYGTTCFNILIGNPNAKAFAPSYNGFYEAVKTGQWKQWVQDIDVKLSFIVKLVARCWKTDPNMRPTFATLCILLQDRLRFLLGFKTGVSFFSLDKSKELKAWAYALNRQYVQGCKAICRCLIQRTGKVTGLEMIGRILEKFEGSERLRKVDFSDFAKDVRLWLKARKSLPLIQRANFGELYDRSTIVEKALEESDPSIIIKGLGCNAMVEGIDYGDAHEPSPKISEYFDFSSDGAHSELQVDASLVPLLVAFWSPMKILFSGTTTTYSH